MPRVLTAAAPNWKTPGDCTAAAKLNPVDAVVAGVELPNAEPVAVAIPKLNPLVFDADEVVAVVLPNGVLEPKVPKAAVAPPKAGAAEVVVVAAAVEPKLGGRVVPPNNGAGLALAVAPPKVWSRS